MKLIELHILQSFPVSCLNRDDVGAPKTAVFGGVNRARISSQCLKRAIREYAAELQPELMAAKRSRLFAEKIASELVALGETEAGRASALAKAAGHYLGKLDPKDSNKVKTMMFLSPLEFQRLAALLWNLEDKAKNQLVDAVTKISPDELAKADEPEGGEEEEEEAPKPDRKDKDQPKPMTAKKFTKLVSRIFKPLVRKEWKNTNGLVKDAADIAIFGRMVASDPSLTLEGAGMFGHALSTHRADNEIDFFAAVDDLQKAELAGAGMTGTLEFTSAVYYRYSALNLDLLYNEKQTDSEKVALGHLKNFAKKEREDVVDAFIRATLQAIPTARHTSMNAHTFPTYVLGIYKDKGQPLQLVNAFEKPVWTKPGQGLLDKSIEALKEHHSAMKKTWNIETAVEVAIPEVDLNTFCQRLTAHVP